MVGSSGVGWTTEDYEKGRAAVRSVGGDSRHTLRRPSPPGISVMVDNRSEADARGRHVTDHVP
jgi:hypothetical protein